MHSRTIFGVPFLSVCSIAAITRLAPATISIAPPMPPMSRPGLSQLARSPLLGNLHGPEHRDVQVTAPHDSEGFYCIEDAHAGSAVTKPPPALVMWMSSSPSGGEPPKPDRTVLRVEPHRTTLRNVVGSEGRDPDSQIHHVAVPELPGNPEGYGLSVQSEHPTTYP